MKQTDYFKCGECKHLSDEKCSIGYKCVCPNKKFRTRVACYKHKSNKACKLFEKKGDNNDR